MKIRAFLFCAVALSAAPVAAQDAEVAVQSETSTAASPVQESVAPMPLPVQTRTQGNAVLPANTEILLQMNQEVTTRGDTWDEGDTFDLTVVHDVMLGDYVVIPRGTGATGRITWLTSRGMFGKSGKMDIELEYIELQGRRIPINGTYRQEGEGATLATVGGVILAGVFGGFITGRSGVIPQGRELMATTEGDIELAIPASAIRREPVGVAPLATPAAAQLVEPLSPQPAVAEASAEVSE